jgi:hypothetical protein
MMCATLVYHQRELILIHQKLLLNHVYHSPGPENRDEVSQKYQAPAQVDRLLAQWQRRLWLCHLTSLDHLCAVLLAFLSHDNFFIRN